MTNVLKTVELFTDGACSGNPGVGGWAALLRYNGVEKELSGAEEKTTNNRMELSAIIAGLSALKHPCNVELYTDSRYAMDGAMKWLVDWEKNGWRTSQKKAVLNSGLWQEISRLLKKHRVKWHWVRGHAGHVENERVDTLARDALQKLKKSISY